MSMKVDARLAAFLRRHVQLCAGLPKLLDVSLPGQGSASLCTAL